MDSTPNNSSFTYSCIIDLYARAAATLYGIIHFDDFYRILNTYYGEGTLSKEQIMAYFWFSKNDDPIYYTQDELIVHTFIPPDEIARTLSVIQPPAKIMAPRYYNILPEEDFLIYAFLGYYEESPGTQRMEKYLTDGLGLSWEDAREIVAEMVFVCRTGSSPTFIADALCRRDLLTGMENELDLLLMGIEIEAGTRQWERLGTSVREMIGG